MTKFERGQSLFELVVAIAISALIIVAIVSLTTNSIQNSNFSKNKTLAATYAQQAMEWLRGQRDSDIRTFMKNVQLPAAIDPQTLLVTWCLKNINWSKSGVCSGTDVISGTPFIRQATFSVTTQNSKKVVEADISVFWTDAQGIHEIKTATNLADMR